MSIRLFPLVLTALLAGTFVSCTKSEQASGSDSGSQSSSAPAPRTAESETSAPSVGSGEGILLKVKWPVGHRYVYRMDLDQQSTNKIPQMPQPMQQNVVMAMTYALSVLKETGDGGREIEIEFLANEMEVKMGGQVVMSFDSKEKAAGQDQNPFAAPYQKMTGSKLRMLLDGKGEIKEIPGLEEWTDTIAGEGPAKAMIAQQFNEGYFRGMADFYMGFLDRPVKVGESWPHKMEIAGGPIGKISIDSKVAFKGRENRDQHNCVVLASTGTMKGTPTPGAPAGPMGKMSLENGRMTSTSWFEPDLGTLIETVADQTMRMKGEMPGPPGAQGPGGFTSDVGQRITVKLVESGKAK